MTGNFTILAKAKALAKSVKCPVIPGSEGVVSDIEEATKVAKQLGFPVFIKAVAGGGGKGIRIAHHIDEFPRLFSAARAEAEVSFNNPDVYLEKMIVRPRHIEVQVLGDKYGSYIHLGERDCTIQRRRQKLIEEAPSPALSEELRQQIGKAALHIMKAAKYHSAGTIEFLLDRDLKFYFMEVNTRIQVEHTVTEELTGIDLVQEQLRIAMGHELKLKQKDVHFRGHVIQCRINAENPAHNFAPSPGLLEYYLPPGGPHVRVDSACYSGYRIPPYYDSMIAKLIIRGKDRHEAIAVTKRALKEFHIGGIQSTISFHEYMMANPDFQNAKYDINYIDDLIESGFEFS